MQELEKILEEIEQRIEKAKKIIVEHPSDKMDEIANDTAEAFIEAYKECQDIIRKHMNDGWIPVEERLPEEGQEVWVSTKTDCVRRGMYTRYFGAKHRGGFICSDGFMWMNTANAWKQYVVPEPHRPERSEEE